MAMRGSAAPETQHFILDGWAHEQERCQPGGAITTADIPPDPGGRMRGALHIALDDVV
jgi:hypothetical protein